MRLLRWLLPVVIAAILVAVAYVYLDRRATLANNAPARPAPLAKGVQASATDYCYTQSQGERPRVDICATRFEEVNGIGQLHGAKIKLYHGATSDAYDLVESEHVDFDPPNKRLYSEGDVKITLGVPADEPPRGRLLSIHSSGVEFSSETGRASTQRAVRFEFQQGGGSAVGAFYDPETQELRLDNQVALDWRGKKPGTRPMHIEAGQAYYFERESKVLLYPWAKLTRGTLHMEAGASEVNLDEGVIRRVDVEAARGDQNQPNRRVEFAAEKLHLNFDEEMQIRTIEADNDARLISTTATARTSVSGQHLDLTFTPAASGDDESALSNAVATGRSEVRAEPVARAGSPQPETRVLRSEVVRMAMRPGGEEIERVETDGAGTLDFLPNRPEQAARSLRGDRIWIDYGAQNRIRQFRSINAFTRTERASKAGAAPRPPLETDSKELLAFFDPRTSELTRLEQNTEFHYTEGPRRAHANRATLEQATNLVTLDGAAHSSDPTGSVDADEIVMNQVSGDFTAEGRVRTTRLPDRKGKSSAMISHEEPLQATARRMESTNDSRKIRYDGDAKAWQGPNRIEGDRIDWDRTTGVLEAHGNVMTQLLDRARTKGAAVFTEVRAPDLTYTESTREAFYSGGMRLVRPGMTVDARQLRAFLSDAESGTSLDKAFADGAVKIVNTTAAIPAKGKTAAQPKRLRTGTSERAEYYAAEQKVVLTGGAPRFEDSLKGEANGSELIWWADNDRLLINGAEGKPAKSTVRKK